jgi:hypothetical protein
MRMERGALSLFSISQAQPIASFSDKKHGTLGNLNRININQSDYVCSARQCEARVKDFDGQVLVIDNSLLRIVDHVIFEKQTCCGFFFQGFFRGGSKLRRMLSSSRSVRTRQLCTHSE